jgi:hypothetical protein
MLPDNLAQTPVQIETPLYLRLATSLVLLHDKATGECLTKSQQTVLFVWADVPLSLENHCQAVRIADLGILVHELIVGCLASAEPTTLHLQYLVSREVELGLEVVLTVGLMDLADVAIHLTPLLHLRRQDGHRNTGRECFQITNRHIRPRA